MSLCALKWTRFSGCKSVISISRLAFSPTFVQRRLSDARGLIYARASYAASARNSVVTHRAAKSSLSGHKFALAGYAALMAHSLCNERVRDDPAQPFPRQALSRSMNFVSTQVHLVEAHLTMPDCWLRSARYIYIYIRGRTRSDYARHARGLLVNSLRNESVTTRPPATPLPRSFSFRS